MFEIIPTKAGKHRYGWRDPETGKMAVVSQGGWNDVDEASGQAERIEKAIAVARGPDDLAKAVEETNVVRRQRDAVQFDLDLANAQIDSKRKEYDVVLEANGKLARKLHGARNGRTIAILTAILWAFAAVYTYIDAGGQLAW